MAVKNHIKTINKQNLAKTLVTGGCGECQTSCQSPARPPAPWVTRFAGRKRKKASGGFLC